MKYFPDNEHDFERLCLAIFRRLWNAPHATRYGRRGQAQRGVDVIGLAEGTEDWHGGQCKHKSDYGDEFSIDEAEQEVAKALKFKPELTHYFIAVSNKRDKTLQDWARKKTAEHLRAGQFTVTVLSWDDLEELLESRLTDIRDQFFGGLTAEAASRLEQAVSAVHQDVRALSDIDIPAGQEIAHIDKAKGLLKEGRVEAARALLDHIRSQSWTRLDPHAKYKWLAISGDTQLSSGEIEDAASSFLDAAAQLPGDDEARALGGIGHELLGAPEKAHQVAEDVLQTSPRSTRARASFIRSAPPETPHADLAATVPDDQRDALDISLALIDRARAQKDHAGAVAYARTAQAKSPSRYEANAMMGTTLAESAIAEGGSSPSGGLVPKDVDALREAERALTAALEQEDRQAGPLTRQEVLLQRSLVLSFLGRDEDAYADVEAAYHLDRSHTEAAVHYGLLRVEQGEVGAGIDILRPVARATASARHAFLLAGLLRRRGETGDRQEAIDLLIHALKDQQGLPESRRLDYLDLCLTLAAASDSGPTRELALGEEAMGGLSPSASELVRSFDALHLGQHEDATRLALSAAETLDDAAEPDLAKRVAVQLQRLSQYKTALKLWRRLAPLDRIDQDTYNLLFCAHKAGEDRAVLETCKTLRDNGQQDGRTLASEVDTLVKYDEMNKATELLQAYSAEHPDDRTVRLHLSALGIRMGRDDLVASSPEQLPPWKELEPGKWALAVQVLRRGEDPAQAVRYAYGALRENFSNHHAHEALIISLLPVPGGDVELPRPTVVDTDSAVCVQEEGTAQPKWYVIEAEDAPRSELEEIGPDHPIAAALVGKAPGETVDLSPGSASGGRPAQIVEVIHKYVYRYRDCLEHSETRFPETAFVWLMRIPKDAEGKPDVREGVERMLTQMREQSEKVDELATLYKEKRVSLHMIGSALGRGAFRTGLFVAGRADLPFWCCNGTDDEWTAAGALLRSNSSVVLDESAIATLFGSRVFRNLGRPSLTLCVPARALQSLREHVQQEIDAADRGGVLAEIDGQPILIENSEEAMVRYREALAEFLKWIESQCQVIGGSDVLGLDKELREKIKPVLGEATLQAIATANRDGHVLWADDWAVAQVASELVGCERVWSQAVVRSLADRGQVAEEVFTDFSVYLANAGYRHTRLSPHMIIRAARDSDWDASRRPFSSLIELLGSAEYEEMGVARVALVAMKEIWQHCPLASLRHAAWTALLEKVGARERGASLLHALLASVDAVFGVNVVGADDAREAIQAALSNRTNGDGRGIVLP